MSSLIDVGQDQWLREHECCEQIYMRIINELSDRDALKVNTTDYDSLSGRIRIHLNQFSTELNLLQTHLDSTYTLTYGEKERRQRLIEDLLSKKAHLTRMFQTSVRRDYAQEGASASQSWYSTQEDSDEPLLGQETSVDALKQMQKKKLAEQDEGLDRLSSIISRQKNIAITIGSEVGNQNELIDEIGTRMDSTNTRIHGEIGTVQSISRNDSTWGYWLVIIILFFAILGVALA